MTRSLLAVLLGALAECPRPQPPVTSEWSVTMTRRQAAKTASATIIIRTAPTQAEPAPHAAVATALAWLALARSAFDAGTFDESIAAARQGISALGEDYRPKLAKDDTAIRIAMADEAIAKGDVKTGATSLIAVLDARIYLYFTRYAATVRRGEP